jgi:hypothetical protein
LTWDPVENALGYNVYYKNNNLSESEYTLFSSVTEATVKISSAIPTSGSWNFDFVVTAINNSGAYIESSYSNIVSVKGEVIDF